MTVTTRQPCVCQLKDLAPRPVTTFLAAVHGYCRPLPPDCSLQRPAVDAAGPPRSWKHWVNHTPDLSSALHPALYIGSGRSSVGKLSVRDFIHPGLPRADQRNGGCARLRANLPTRVSRLECGPLSHGTPGGPYHSNMAAKSWRLQLHLDAERRGDRLGGAAPKSRLPAPFPNQQRRAWQASASPLRSACLACACGIVRSGTLGHQPLLSIRR
jgi:hypothetical protein